MLYAQVVLGLPIEGPFDYIVPLSLQKKIKVGCRVWINFRDKRKLGYVVKLTQKTNIKNLKTISEVIDESPILDKNMLLLTKELSDYYCCTFGEAIETALPEDLRKGKKLNADSRRLHADGRGFSSEQNLRVSALDLRKSALKDDIVLIHDLDGKARWNIYLKEMREVLAQNKSTIVLLPDINSVLKAKEMIKAEIGISPALLYRKQPQELTEWLKIREGEINIVIGTRSSIFAPLNNLGMVIIDEEQDTVYKQEQMPHYNAREVAFMRIAIEKARLILGSATPSLESFYLSKKNKLKYIFISRNRDFPEIKLLDTKTILSRYLIDAIISSLNAQEKILLFLNRKGFATFASCHNCGMVLKCPRCNINLVYHFKDAILNCHYCDFKMPPPAICPNCDSGYIRYSGIGTEKIESELARILPQARIKILDTPRGINLENTDILISTKHIIKETNYKFDLIAALSIDNYLNRIDFRSGEKTFNLLVGLIGLTQKNLIIQTRLPRHHCFKALEDKDMNIFYDKELQQRKQLRFPPYSHIGLVKLRGMNEIKVKEAGNYLFKRLSKYNKNKTLKLISVNPGQPAKLRGNFYGQLLIMADEAKKISRFLKKYLKDFSRSGIIVTVDIDPL